jgi:transposase InsO family protein
MENSSIGGSRYFLTFIDDKSRKIFIYFLQNKSGWEESRAFQDFKNLAETQTGRKLKILRTDNGTEYKNSKFQEIFRQNGIVHQTTNVHTPEQNGLSERQKRICLRNFEQKQWHILVICSTDLHRVELERRQKSAGPIRNQICPISEPSAVL